jgi:hypothetical protein
MPSRTARIALLPITVQPHSGQDFDYDRDNELLIELTNSISAKIQQLPVDFALIPNYDLIALKGGPSVYVGSSESDNAPYGITVEKMEEEIYDPMVIFLNGPTKSWASEAAMTLQEQNAEHLLHIWVSFAEYPKAEKGLVKTQVHLGTNYSKETRFLRDDTKPVEVLQIVGLLTDSKGNVVRAGAEGVIHNDTGFWLQILDIKELINDEMLERVLSRSKRNDLPGDPLALDVALENLVAQLLDRNI